MSDAVEQAGDRRDRPPTIYDVARAAGVSASTVSRAYARPGRVNAATAERVRKIAAELGYRANPLASALPTGRTSMLALVTSDVTNPVYGEIIRGAESAAAEADNVLILIDAQESDRLERNSLERVLLGVDGVVLAGSRMPDSAIRAVARRRPMIVLNRDLADVPSIVLDNRHAMRLVAEHLANLGHRDLLYISGPEASWVDGMRWSGIREAAAGLGQTVQRAGPFVPTVEGGHRAAGGLDDSGPTAILAYNDQQAIGLMRVLQSRGIRVPRDISVVGFDDIYPARIVTPGLTTVAAPLRAQGRAAVTALLSRSVPVPSRPMTLPVKLIVRDSTARRRPFRISRPATP